MANADGYVLPKPGIPKTLGILNVIFGVLLVLVGICTIGSLVAAPAMMQFAEKTVKEAQSKVEAQQKAEDKAFEEREAAAKTDEEKQAIEKERADAKAARPQLNQMDLSAATDVLKNPTVMAYTYGGLVTGLILQVVLLISGIGLIRLRPWGRTLALWWAGLQIVQVAILMVANLAVVLPISRASTEKQIEKLEANAKAPGAGPAQASALQMTKAMAPLQVPMAVGTSLGGMIYPVIVLILLNTNGARAACLPRKIENIEDV